MPSYDMKKFFDAVRKKPFGGSLTSGQVEGMEAIISTAPKSMPVEFLAYELATTYHEVNGTMMPIRENLNYSSAERIRSVWPSRFPTVASAQPYVNNPQKLAEKVYGNRLGNDNALEGWIFRGRSFVQITGEDNYERAEQRLGVELTDDPDVVLDPKISAQILHFGMTEGWFTGKKLSDYFGNGKEDPVGARKIINPDSNGSKIAAYYRDFLAALKAAKLDGEPIPSAPAPSLPEEPKKPIPVHGVGEDKAEEETSTASLAKFVAWVASFFRKG